MQIFFFRKAPGVSHARKNRSRARFSRQKGIASQSSLARHVATLHTQEVILLRCFAAAKSRYAVVDLLSKSLCVRKPH